MSEEAPRRPEVAETHEAAPGLAMETISTTEADGRYLVYYNFHRTAAPSGPAELTLQVPDMVCEDCVRAVRSALSGIAGVENVEVDLARKLVTVRCGPAVAGEAALRAALERVGFPAD